MTLRDHFHAPLSIHHDWHSFHHAWATAIAIDLNTHLPETYFAKPNVQFGIQIEVPTLTPPTPMQRLPFQLSHDTVEVMIFSTDGGPTLVGVIELLTPTNKACPEPVEWDSRSHRETFVSKCETYLRQGVGLVLIDIVTNQKSNLHNQLLARLTNRRDAHLSAALYAVSYRVIEQAEQSNLDLWPERLSLGQPLPTIIPFWLRGDIYLPLALNNTYERVCRELRIR